MKEQKTRERFAKCWVDAESSISAYVFASVSNFHDAEDLVQRIAQELARRFEDYDPTKPFVGWALWIAKSRIIDFYRSQGRSRLVFTEETLDRLQGVISDQSRQRNARRDALESCLDKLPGRSRELLDLRYVDNLSASEVAEVTGSTSGSVRVLLSRARTSLADCIQRRLAMDSLR